MMGLVRRLWDRLSIYLPILLMSLFALATLWLVRSTPAVVEAVAKKPVKHEVDYFLKNFSIKTFDATGRLKTEIFGADAQHFPDTDTLEIEQIRTRSVSEDGQVTVATARRAISDAEGTDIQLLGNVHVVQTPRAGASGAARPPVEYRSEFLQVLTETERLSTHLPVVITRGPDRFSGNAMSYDKKAEVFELTGQVRGILNPKKAR